MNFKPGLFLFLLITSTFCYSQQGFEREHRIKKSQFPLLNNPQLVPDQGIKQLKYYKETDHSLSQYILRFKRDRIKYYMNFDNNGTLLKLGLRVNAVDIPSASYTIISTYLDHHFDRFKIRRMFQEYAVTDRTTSIETVKNAFQNMLLPDNQYKILLRGKNDGEWITYEAYFKADGEFIKIRHALPPDYDHILY